METIMVIDDEVEITKSCDTILRMAGYQEIITCNDSRDVLDTITENKVDLVLLDLSMPYISGSKLLTQIKNEYPHIQIVVITGDNTIEKAVECMREGAFDYLVKPLDKERLLNTVKHSISLAMLSNENKSLRKQLLSKDVQNPRAFSSIVTGNSEMQSIFCYLEAVAPTTQPIMITGETGVGKELMAKAAHDVSGRKGKLVTVNVAGLDENVFSDTLFGHAKGAYTGANEKRVGMVEQAADGTLFLDEIGDLHPNSQVKLLRLLQEKEYLPLGVDIPKRSTARVVLATNRNLKELLKGNGFRKDLYYRLIAHQLEIPSLRSRKDDLPFLIDYFMEEAAQEVGIEKPKFPPALIPLLYRYAFPGNVRELRAMVFNAMTQVRSQTLPLEPFKAHIGEYSKDNQGEPIDNKYSEDAINFGKTLPTMNEVKGLLIEEALKRTGGKISHAAEMIGMTRQTLSLWGQRIN